MEEETYGRFLLRVKLSKLTNLGILGPIILHEILWDQTDLVQGWVRTDGYSCWHLWVEKNGGGTVFDPLKDLHSFDVEYLKDKPDGEVDENEEVLESYKLYTENAKEFWKTRTPNIREFRSKCFLKLKK
jgi:hypothetical protein